MTRPTFDTLGYFDKLKAAGVPEGQAKAQADALLYVIEDKLVTKDYLDNRLGEVKHEILKWMMGMFIAQSALIVAIISFLK